MTTNSTAKPPTRRNLRIATDHMADDVGQSLADKLAREWIRDAATPDDLRNADPLMDLPKCGEVLALEILSKLGAFLEEELP